MATADVVRPRRRLKMHVTRASLARRARSSIHRVEAVVRGPLSRVNPEPAFLLGNQRSGTTAVGAILAEVTRAPVALDLSREVYAPTFDKVRLGQMDLEEHIGRNRLAFSRPIIKEPHLTPFYSELKARFPGARFALVVRDARDNIRSLFDYLELPGKGDHEINSRRLRQRRAWRLVVDGRWLGITAPTRLAQLAHRWNMCADVYLENRDSVAVVRYEDFVLDRRGTAHALAEKLGLPCAGHEGERGGHDAARAFQPRGPHRDQTPLEFFGPENLRVIEDICGERMAQLGYSLDGG